MKTKKQFKKAKHGVSQQAQSYMNLGRKQCWVHPCFKWKQEIANHKTLWVKGSADGETAHQMRKKMKQFKVAELILVPLFNHLVAEQSLKWLCDISFFWGGGMPNVVLIWCPLPEDIEGEREEPTEQMFIAVLAEMAKNWRMFKCQKSKSPSKPLEVHPLHGIYASSRIQVL